MSTDAPLRLDEPTCLDRLDIDAAELAQRHPPRLRHPHKQLAYALACPPGRPLRGRVGYRRYAALELPERRALSPCAVSVRPDVYDYAPAEGAVWHVNFADPQLFVAYGSALLAQDELQALEHPALGPLREALLAAGMKAVTEEDGEPTPVLVTGVERRLALDTAPDYEAGRPQGLYGNRFATAPRALVESALRVLSPAPLSNLIAIAAPAGGRGRYSLDHIEGVLETALTAFRAAAVESRALGGGPVEVRTGFWGCGAFGGNRVLMALLQVLAARMAGLDRLTFYAFDQAGVVAFEEGAAALDAILRGGAEGEAIDDLIGRIEARGYQWGVSDGT